MKTLKNKEIREFIEDVKEKFGAELDKKSLFEQDSSIMLINKDPAFFYLDKKLVPTLKILLKGKLKLKTITIDMGAVPFAAKGADMMRPGITDIDDGIEEGDLVVIIDENHHKPIAIGTAMFSSKEMSAMEKGKAVKNIHYVGDDIWTYT